jgi:hypothetical protein
MSSQLQNNLFTYYLDLYETLETGLDDGSNDEPDNSSDVDTDSDSGSDDGSDYEDPTDAEFDYLRIIDEWTASTQATNLANMQEELAQNQDIIPIYLPEYSSHR